MGRESLAHPESGRNSVFVSGVICTWNWNVQLSNSSSGTVSHGTSRSPKNEMLPSAAAHLHRLWRCAFGHGAPSCWKPALHPHHHLCKLFTIGPTQMIACPLVHRMDRLVLMLTRRWMHSASCSKKDGSGARAAMAGEGTPQLAEEV